MNIVTARALLAVDALVLGRDHAQPFPSKQAELVTAVADTRTMFVRAEQPRLAQLAVHREHDLRADAGHRLEVDGRLGTVLAECQHPARSQAVALCARLHHSGPPCGIVHHDSWSSSMGSGSRATR